MIKKENLKVGNKYKIIANTCEDFHKFDIGSIVTYTGKKTSTYGERFKMKNKNGKYYVTLEDIKEVKNKVRRL